MQSQLDSMKIAFIYDAIYPWVKGGAEKRIYEIGRRLADKHEVHWYGIGWWFNENGSDLLPSLTQGASTGSH